MNSPETRQLLLDIESKDRHFRSSVMVFASLLVLLTAGIIFLQNLTLIRVNDQLRLQKEATEELKKDTHDQLTKQTNYILCIAKFFTIKDRANTTIQSLDDCVLANGGQIIPAPTNIVAPPATQSSNSTANTPSQQSPAQVTPVPQTSPQPTPPVTILGVPVCIPLTKMCVR